MVSSLLGDVEREVAGELKGPGAIKLKAMINECPLGCTSGFEPSHIVLPEGPLLKCRDCGQLVSSANEETYKRRFQPFDENNPIDPNPSVHRKRLRKVERLAGSRPGETCILDVGCNVGTFLHEAKARGFTATGVEPDRRAVEIGVGSGLDIRCGYLHEVGIAESSYDIITLFEVIEHLWEPIPLMQECRRILKPSGLVLLTTGNTQSWTVKFLGERWDYFDLALGHVSFFCPSSIVRLAEKAGFEVEKIETKSVSVRNGSSGSRLWGFARKMIGEALNVPARVFCRGHDMFVVLKKNA
ncbi:MAG: class I SAM-dependent methyltransferase [Desulfatiglandales bacterium]